MVVKYGEHTHIRIITINHTIITIICITMAVSMAMAIIDMVEIDIMAAGTTIEDITADIMVVAVDTMAVDMEEVLIGVVDTMAEVAEDMAEPVVGDMPEAETIEAAATAEAVVLTEAVELTAVVVEEEVVAVAEVVDVLLQGVLSFPSSPIVTHKCKFYSLDARMFENGLKSLLV